MKAGDTLTTLQNDINNLGAGLSAGIITDSSSNPYRLSLTATQSGQAGNMIVDASQISGMSLEEMAQGQNALLALGSGGSNSARPNAPVVVSSSSNTFAGVLPGVSLQVNGAGGQPVSVTVGNDGTNISSNLQTLVTNYNNFRSQLTTDTAYNTTTETGAVLSDDGSALELDTQLSQLLHPHVRLQRSGAIAGRRGHYGPERRHAEFQSEPVRFGLGLRSHRGAADVHGRQDGRFRPVRHPDQPACRTDRLPALHAGYRPAERDQRQPVDDHPDELSG